MPRTSPGYTPGMQKFMAPSKGAVSDTHFSSNKLNWDFAHVHRNMSPTWEGHFARCFFGRTCDARGFACSGLQRPRESDLRDSVPDHTAEKEA